MKLTAYLYLVPRVKNALPYTISGDAAEFTNSDTSPFARLNTQLLLLQ